MKLVSDRRNECLEVGYRVMLESPCFDGRVTFTLDEFKEGCKEFDVYGFFEKEIAGMTFLDRNNAHIAILEKFHGKCGVVIKQALKLFLKKADPLIADVHFKNDKAIKFIERLGFKYKKTNGEIITYILGAENV